MATSVAPMTFIPTTTTATQSSSVTGLPAASSISSVASSQQAPSSSTPMSSQAPSSAAPSSAAPSKAVPPSSPSQAPAGVVPAALPAPPSQAPGGGLPAVAAPSGPQGGPPPGAHGAIDMKKINPYIYNPSFSMAVVGSAAFLITAGFHFYQLFKYKTWYFAIMAQAVLISSVAMIARTHSVMTLKETGASGPYIVFMMMDMVGPTMVIIANIFTLTRVIWWVTPNERRNIQTLKVPPKMISFIWAGMFSVADIGKAIGQNAFKPTDPTGTKIQGIGQVLQVFVLLGHFMFALRFMRMSGRWLIHGAAEEKKWRSLGWTTVIVAGILTVRHVFTVVSFDARSDPQSFFSLHEWMYWVTETIPLFVCFALYNFNFPGEFLPREYTGWVLKLKVIEKAKFESPWPLTISSPIQCNRDDKRVEITLTELENGKRDGRSRR